MGEVFGVIMALLIILLVFIIVISILAAIIRWVFRINDTIALLESIDQKLTKLTEDKA
jgi:hypothetical protein